MPNDRSIHPTHDKRRNPRFDELDNPVWPGETLALVDTFGIHKLRLERLEFDPYIAFVSIR